mmetsp:Transcript_34042/g.106632  ORF Transcript_34042/g.106632 Transcript_34042/m.106632 type:complete len:258 (-) Transcript_34042:185-958(-)
MMREVGFVYILLLLLCGTHGEGQTKDKQLSLRRSATTHLRRLSRSQDFVVYTRPDKSGNSTWKTASAFEAANSTASSFYQFLPSYSAYTSFMQGRSKSKTQSQAGDGEGRPLSIGMWQTEGFLGPKTLRGSQGGRKGSKRGGGSKECNVTSECEQCSEASLQDNADYCMKTGWMQRVQCRDLKTNQIESFFESCKAQGYVLSDTGAVVQMEAGWAFFLVVTWTWMKRRKRLQPGSRLTDKSEVQIPMRVRYEALQNV